MIQIYLEQLISYLSYQSKNHIFSDQEDFDFSTDLLYYDRLREYGLSEKCLDILSSGTPEEFKATFEPEQIGPIPSPRAVNFNNLLVSRVIAALVVSGDVFPVTLNH